MLIHRSVIVLAALAAGVAVLAQAPQPTRGPFGLSRIATASGAKVPVESFGALDDCSTCHERQVEEFDGSFHSVSHRDPLYRAFAELARKEAGPEVYAYCSGCHSPAGVVSGLIPGTPEAELPEVAKAGVQCDVCHQISALTGASEPFKEPGNASFVLDPGKAKATLRAEIKANPAHGARRAELLEGAELCAACHTVIHPLNGLRIEHTYDEWRRSVYAEKGIVCQDCHMRSVEDATEVAKTLQRKRVLGRTSGMSGEEREIHPHFFVGGNVEAERLTGSAAHARMAEARLRSAATISIEPAQPVEGELAFSVAVTNVGAGHSLPTSLTELRQMWVHLRVTDSHGKVLFESGALDEHGELTAGAMRFGAETLDAAGKLTFKPWEAVHFGWKRLVGPKATERDTFSIKPPADPAERVTVEARLLYRVAPPHVLREVMGEQAFEPRVVEMASARAELAR